MRTRQARDEHVLEHGHAAEELCLLERPRDAHRGIDVRWAAAHPLPADQHVSAIGLEMAGQHIMSVVLPEPFGPISPRRSPSATTKSTASLATRPPNRLTRPTPRTSSARPLTCRIPCPARWARRTAD